MPKLELGGFVIRAYLDDHAPPHVHVIRGPVNLRVYLNGQRGADRVYGRMSSADERRAVRVVAEHRKLLLKLWDEAHR